MTQIFAVTNEVYNPKYLTSVRSTSIEYKAKPEVQNTFHQLANMGKKFFTKQEILDILEKCYAFAGSTKPKAKARIVWGFYAKPGKDMWFIQA